MLARSPVEEQLRPMGVGVEWRDGGLAFTLSGSLLQF